jgi:hypothetical protein
MADSVAPPRRSRRPRTGCLGCRDTAAAPEARLWPDGARMRGARRSGVCGFPAKARMALKAPVVRGRHGGLPESNWRMPASWAPISPNSALWALKITAANNNLGNVERNWYEFTNDNYRERARLRSKTAWPGLLSCPPPARTQKHQFRPISPPSGPAQRLFQDQPAKSNFPTTAVIHAHKLRNRAESLSETRYVLV